MNELEPRKLSFDLSDFIDDVETESSKVLEYEEQQKRMEQDRLLEKYKQSGVPEKFFDSSLETYIAKTEEEKKNLKTVTDFSKNPQNRILILCGNNGNGKSHLACGVIRNCGGEYVISSKLCIEYDAAISYHSKRTREEIIAYYSKQKMLVIDECGKYTLNDKLEQFLLALIVSIRYENDLPTVLVTNGKKNEFIDFLGKSVFDRLTEVCTTLDFTGESKRKERRIV